MSMGGKVFLKQNLGIKLHQEIRNGKQIIKFKKKFNPLAAQVVPISKLRESKDFQLAQHIKHLLALNENGAFGNIEIVGEIFLFYQRVNRPSETVTDFSAEIKTLRLNLAGSFPWFLNTLHNEGSSASFEIQLENVLAGTEQKCTFTFSELFDNGSSAKDLSNEDIYLSYSCRIRDFPLNAVTWDLLFRPKANGSKSPKLSLVVCADISERMAQSLLIISPHGSNYILSPHQNEIKNERLQEVFAATQPDTLVVGQSGKEWRVRSKYLIDSSPVFQAMLEKPNFEEGRTNRVNLDDLEDKVIDCLLQYIYWFDMGECQNDVCMAGRMLEISDRFQVNGLTKALEEMLMRRTNYSPTDAIKLFFHVRRLEHFTLLRRKILIILYQTRQEWTNSEEYKQKFMDDPELAWDLMTSCFQNGVFP